MRTEEFQRGFLCDNRGISGMYKGLVRRYRRRGLKLYSFALVIRKADYSLKMPGFFTSYIKQDILEILLL